MLSVGSSELNDRGGRLLPAAKRVTGQPGRCRIASDVRLDVDGGDDRVRRAADRWIHSLSSGPGANPPLLRIRVNAAASPEADGYRLTIRPETIDLAGNTAAWCFFGLQTLAQICRGEPASVPCGEIEDGPDFAARGLLLDISRGRVPTLPTLKRLADRLAALKVNQLQLYIEHAFVFPFDADICGADEGLTPDEVRDLDIYCRERFIDLVPALATPGHMGRILSMPRYRHLAEIEADASWARTPWPQRARGLTLDCLRPESHQLVTRMWSDVLDAFSGPVVNLCGDEPWDLGRGRNPDGVDRTGAINAYVEHLLRVYEQCSSRGKRVQVWSDVLCRHPELLERLPGDLTILHWGYDDTADYDGTRRFVDAGFDTAACPGTSGWKRIINAIGLAERNITTFARRGLECGATGLVNTDWGDHGHFHPPACSLHGIALGAACGWDAECLGGAEFDARVAATLWNLPDSSLLADLRRSAAVADTCETWRQLWRPIRSLRDDLTLPAVEAADEARHHAERCLAQLAALPRIDPDAAHDLEELAAVCRFTRLYADKVAIAHGRCAGDWPERLMAEISSYAELWHLSSKPSGLADIVSAIERAAEDLRGETV